MVIEHVNTELMIADPLTKGMPPFEFKDHVMNMGLGSIMYFFHCMDNVIFSEILNYCVVFSHTYVHLNLI